MSTSTDRPTRRAPAGRSAGRVLAARDLAQPVLLLASITAGLALGTVSPPLASLLGGQVGVAVFVLIALTMTGARVGQLAAVWRQGRFLAAALVLNFVVNPIVAWALGMVLLRDQPDLRAGLMLFLVTPCIGWYLAFTQLAGGDLELGVGLLAINIVAQIVLLPVYLAVFVDTGATPPTSVVLRSVGLFFVVPALIGVIAAKVVGARRLARSRRALDAAKTGALSALIVALFAANAATILNDLGLFTRIVVPTVLFFAIAFVLARRIGAWLGLAREQTTLLVFTTMARNSELSLAIAVTAFVSPLVAAPIVLGPVIELPLLMVAVELLRRRPPPITALNPP